MRLDFAGKSFFLKPLTLGDLVDLEARGVKLDKLDKPGDIKMAEIQAVAFMVLKRADNTVTEDWVRDNVDVTNIMEVFSTVLNFTQETFGVSPKPKSTKSLTTSEEGTGGAKETSST